ncbi:MAG: pyridoxal phosphate-dependent aminotransferase [Lachnospiraceae bacterium]|nr:pyridoxal phosphate-dependent aminotransferase [Lachnospiraceae bacterium]
MISKKMSNLVKNSSAIRAMFEEGRRMAEKFGKENVYDYSLGNPSVPAPEAVNRAYAAVAENPDSNYVHGYMLNQGFDEAREAIAKNLNERFPVAFTKNDIVMTVGAAGGMNVIMKTLLDPGDEVVVFAPYFGEYRNYVSNFDGVLVEVAPDTSTFQPDLKALEEKLTARTKIVIINTPNNPTGVVYSAETLTKLGQTLEEAQRKFGTSIYLLSDEPYRELVYDGAEVPFVTTFYRNTIVGYSYSKSLSLPGDRIGYLVIPAEVDDHDEIFAAAGVATRILGFVNAPSVAQLAVAKCLNESVDVAIYDRNRKLLYEKLKEYGYDCIMPQGAFYLFVKALEPDDKAFVAKAKEHRLLIVPGSTFGCAGYVRIAYCVDYDMIVRSLPAFKELAEQYKK